jgi:hypothetical protein
MQNAKKWFITILTLIYASIYWLAGVALLVIVWLNFPGLILAAVDFNEMLVHRACSLLGTWSDSVESALRVGINMGKVMLFTEAIIVVRVMVALIRSILIK